MQPHKLGDTRYKRVQVRRTKACWDDGRKMKDNAPVSGCGPRRRTAYPCAEGGSRRFVDCFGASPALLEQAADHKSSVRCDHVALAHLSHGERKGQARKRWNGDGPRRVALHLARLPHRLRWQVHGVGWTRPQVGPRLAPMLCPTPEKPGERLQGRCRRVRRAATSPNRVSLPSARKKKATWGSCTPSLRSHRKVLPSTHFFPFIIPHRKTIIQIC